jgi:hypothetical protein
VVDDSCAEQLIAELLQTALFPEAHFVILAVSVLGHFKAAPIARSFGIIDVVFYPASWSAIFLRYCDRH